MSLLHAHLVFVSKYRRAVFTGDILSFCEHTMRAVCADLDAELVEFNGEPDHIHLLVAYPPTLAISVLAQRLKGRAHLRSPSYFAVSYRGAPLSIIKQYINGQTRPL